MGSTYQLSNQDLAFLNASGQDFSLYVAFLNPIAITTNWSDLNLDSQGNWQAPPNFDTCAAKAAPYKPICNLGSNRIGFVNEPLTFCGLRSNQRYDLAVPIGSAASWTFTGNPTLTFYSGFGQVQAVWSTPGLYTASLLVTGANGAQTMGTRQVMIYPDRDNAMNGVISISGLSGSIASGGWQCQITTTSGLINLLPPDSVPAGTYYPFVVMAETRYEYAPDYWINATIGPMGSFSPGQPYQDPRILFDGYVQNGTMHQDVDKDSLSFSCQGPQLILQETKTHMLGYYNATNKTYGGHAPGTFPTSLNTSSIGKGYLVGGLMTVDVIQSMMQTHTNFAQYHDIHMWNANIVTAPYQSTNANAYYNIIYSTLTVNEGTIWQNITDIGTNEWVQAYFAPNGGLCVGPSINFQGQDYWSQPTLLGHTLGASLVNFLQDLGYTLGSDITQLNQNLPTLPALPIPVVQTHPWGNRFSSFSNHIFQNGLTGPPVLCVLSDTPVYDSGIMPPTYLDPMLQANWPQDLAIYPISFDFPENYTGRAALIKLIGTCFGHSTTLTSWYPQNTFLVAGDGTSTIVTTVLPAGDWIVNEQHVIGDVTTAQQQALVVNWFWEMARREYYAHNMNYTGSATLGMATFASLGDIVAISRQNNVTGPHWNGKLFYINEIIYTIDLTARTWATTLNLTEVTSSALGPPLPPPKKTPKF